MSETKASPTPSIVPVPESEEKLYNGVSTLPLWRLYTLVFALVLHFICNSGAIQSNNVAVGFIAQDLMFEELQIQWIQSAYQLSSGCLLLLFVPLCDRLGARSIAIFAAGFYTVWAIACANAQTPNQFIIFRALQGIGACAGIPAAFSILGQVLPVIEGSGFRALILSIYSAGAPLGSGLGTIIGGLATQYSAIQWRGIYAAFAGINGLSFILLILTCPPSPTKLVPGGVDYSGAALITVSLTLIIFCLSQGPAVGWSTSYVVALLVIGCVLLPVFVAYELWLERKGSTPMLRMSNFARGRYLAMNGLGLVGFASFVTWDYYAGLYYQQVQDQQAVQVMLRYMPQSLFAFLAAPAATFLLQHISTQLVFQFGALSAAMSGLIFAVSHVDDTYWSGAQFLSFALGITGACFVYCSGMLYSVSVVVPAEQSAAGGLFQVMTSLASAIGLVFSSIVANAHTSTTEPDKSFRYGFWVSVAYGLFAVVAAIPLLWGIGVLNKTGETARVEALVAHHHEKELFDKHAEQPEYCIHCSPTSPTWLENDYPGLACDIPAHAYHLTFEPNLSWSSFYATGGEILSYLKKVVDKYQLTRFIRLRHLLTGAEWSEEKGHWTLSFDLLDEGGVKVGEVTKLADVVLQGMGGLNRWNWPDIEGIHNFKGTLLHSAKYDEAPEDSKGKRVAVIGSGSSAIQIVPALQPYADQLDQYVRGSAWIAAPFASSELLKRSPNGTNHKFTEEELARFRDDKEFYDEFRHAQEAELNCLHHLTFHGSAGQVAAVAEFKEAMTAKLAKKPEIAERLIPAFPVACRRLTPGTGYLEALVEDNVDFRPVDIKRITATGIEGADGEHREYDSIVCATGFDSTYRPRVPIVGRNGKNVQDIWSEISTNHLSMAIGPDFPNYFMINGPNSATGAGSLIIILEREVDYLVEALAKIQRENIKAMSVKQDAVDDFMAYVTNYFPATVFGQPCRSWYKAGKLIGPVVALWPGSCLHAVKTFKYPRWEDYEYVSANTEHENRLGWMGNGWAEEDDGGDTAFYLKEVDYPPVPTKTLI